MHNKEREMVAQEPARDNESGACSRNHQPHPNWHPLVPWATETTEHGNKFRGTETARNPTETTEKQKIPPKHLQKVT
jgi:hypothetical protein